MADNVKLSPNDMQHTCS